jgi:hypothetical protein
LRLRNGSGNVAVWVGTGEKTPSSRPFTEHKGGVSNGATTSLLQFDSRNLQKLLVGRCFVRQILHERLRVTSIRGRQAKVPGRKSLKRSGRPARLTSSIYEAALRQLRGIWRGRSYEIHASLALLPVASQSVGLRLCGLGSCFDSSANFTDGGRSQCQV